MKFHLRGGEFSLADIAKGRPLALIHGGAAAVDNQATGSSPGIHPSHEAFPRVEAELARAGTDSIRPSAFLATLLSEASEAEKYVLNALRLLEEEPSFNAGRGAALQSDGVPRVSASFMESERLNFSALMNAEGILCPSELAFFLQKERYTVLDHRGAESLANRLGIAREDLVTPARRAAWERQERGKTGTVGSVALDHLGKIAAGTSTGGLGHEVVGRVGDTPTVAGNYASTRAAVSCTGIGEQILDLSFASRTVIRVEDGLSLADAFARGLGEAAARGYKFAAIAVAYHPNSRRAEWAAGATTSRFLWSAATPKGWERTDL